MSSPESLSNMSRAQLLPKPKRVIKPAGGLEDVEPLAGSSFGAQGRFKKALAKTKKLYQYTKLPPNSLRLLVLKPSTTDVIHVELKEVSFDDLGKTEHYEALSYHWGPMGQAESEPIFLDNSTTLSSADSGQPGGRLDIAGVISLAEQNTIWIRHNLYAALQCIREKTGDLCIWVDAICINQDDREEKQDQVARMSEIYSNADRVLIWLGPGNERTERAMGFIDKVLEIEHTRELVNNATNDVWYWQDLIYLLRRSWFSRRWVIQELALAQDAIVICGDRYVHWLDMADAISLFAENFDAIRSSFKRSEEFDNDFHAIGEINPLPAHVLVNVISNIFKKTGLGQNLRREPIHTLEYLVSTLARFGTSDPRDTINCFRNIAKETYTYGPKMSGLPQPPEMDYKSDLFQVYAGFIDWIYRDSRKIDILCRRWAHPAKLENAAYTSKSVKSLPSWIQTIAAADFDDNRIGLRLHGDSFVGSPDHTPYNASHNRMPKIRFSPGCLPSPNSTPSPRSEQNMHYPADSPHRSDVIGIPSRQPSSVVDGDMSLPPSGTSDVLQRTATLTPAVGTSNPRDSGIGFKPQAEHVSPEPNVETMASSHQPRSDYPESAIKTNQQISKLNPNAQKSSGSETKRDKSLWVQGMVIGTVSWRADPITDGVITETVVEKLRGKVPEGDNEPVSDKFWRLLVAERASNGQQPPTTYRRACQWMVDQNPMKNYINAKELLTKTLPSMVRDYLKRVQGVVWNRCFIEVQQRKISQNDNLDYSTPLHGFGSGKTKKDDLLCILFGCSVPVILRLRDDEPDRCFKFLGEAYVYGVMDGEALYSLTEKEIQQHQEEFRIF